MKVNIRLTDFRYGAGATWVRQHAGQVVPLLHGWGDDVVLEASHMSLGYRLQKRPEYLYSTLRCNSVSVSLSSHVCLSTMPVYTQ